MFRQVLAPVLCLSLAIGAGGCQEPASDPPPPESTASPETQAIVFGDISSEPIETISEAQPCADYLAAHLGEFGIGRGEVKVAPDMETMAQWLKTGEVDLYSDSPYPALIVSEESGAKPMLRRWKDGIAQYHTVIFARGDRGLQSLDDLNGKTIAFEENFSTSAYLLPLGYLRRAGYQAVEIESADATIPPDRIGYIFTGDDENSIQWVISGKVAAGAIDSATFERIPEATRAQLTILAETETVPRHMILMTPQMDSQRQEAIAEILVKMDENPEGKSILEGFDQTSQFDRLPGQDPLSPIRELYQQIQKP
ncbi:MAG: phosphate/phosphite/phosphonate ABC transporter substrate-binding protein [Cyanobacteria bacterium J055]|nr:MAG: phosphate/phosphite/phosphonate ABC transporter substrate-binding protein [Cyanobacteria bacterium J055]